MEFKGIKVKEGGCIYAGQAITNSVDLALLNQKQRAALAKAYAIFNKVLDKIEENADGVAETINGFLDGLQKAKQKAQALNAKIAAGQTPTEAEVKTLAKLEDQNLKTMTTAIDQLKKKYKDDINTEALALMEGYMADKRAAATALANYKPSMGPPPAAILQATANSQPELIDKTMKSVGPLMIAYNGKEYPIKKEKTINVVESKNSVNIKNLTEGDAYSWTLSDGTTGSTNPVSITFPDGKNELTLEVTQGNRKTNVTLKKKVLTYTDLIAIDKSHTGRKALASKGETLYLVRSPNTTRTINYQMTTTGVKGDFDNSEPLWSTTLPKNSLYEGEVLNSTGSIAGETRHSSPAKGKVFSTAVGKMLDVKVEVLPLDKSDHEIYPPATTAALESIAESTKKYIGIFKKYSGGKTIEPNFELKFTGTQFNEETPSSPLYRTVREGGVNLELGIVGTLPIPALSITIPKVGSVGAYLEMGANVGLTTKVIYRKPVNTSSYKIAVNQFDFEAKGEIEFGARAISAVPSWVGVLDLRAYGKSGIFAEQQNLGNLSPEDNFSIGFSPLVAGINAVLELGGVDIVNYKYEKTIIDKYIIWKAK